MFDWLRIKCFVSASLGLVAVVLATPGSACELDGLPGVHRYNPFLRYPTGPGVEPDSSSQQMLATDSSAPVASRDRDEPETERNELRQPEERESDSGNGPSSYEGKALFK